MCGIAGLVTAVGERPDEAVLQAMTASLLHRGPDAGGCLVDRNVGLGHRRLTIIDLSEAADQPLYNEDRSVAMIYNGEIYNFQELRSRLSDRGHRFATRTDSEVLVHGWEEHGPDLLRHLRGMYAFALYDRRAGRLLLARDRLGKKPLYYARVPGGLAFASEIKALLRHPGVSRELDLRAVGEYMVYGNTAGERTVFAAIRSLPPGGRMVIEATAGEPTFEIDRYWRFEPRPDPGLDPDAWLEELDATLCEAVRLRMIADVPLGAFLSGGIDSSLVVAQMARLAPGGVRTFTIGFREAGWDESAHAAAVARHLGTDHRVEEVTPDAVAVLPELVEAYDEPFADPSAVPTYYVSQLTRRHVKVALSGDGGDELFYGYRRYLESAALERLGRWITPLGRGMAGGAAGLLPRGAYLRRALERLSLRGFDLYHHALGYAPTYLSLLTPSVREALGPAGDQEAAADFRRTEGLPFLDRCRAMDLDNYLPDQILVKMDRASMRNSLEVRCPLLDQEVVELAARMPAAAQVSARRGKLLLRRLAYRYVPRELLDRPKQGFSVPLGRWFREELEPLIRQAVEDRGSPTWKCFDRTEARRRLEHHLAGRLDAGPALWRLLFFHAWAARYLAP